MKTRQNFAKIIAAAALVASSAMYAGTASAQSFGSGMHHHTGYGTLGVANHLTYGDMHSNQMHKHHGHHHLGTHFYNGVHLNKIRYMGDMNDAGHPTGQLHPGMVLPDGAIVVSVGK